MWNPFKRAPIVTETLSQTLQDKFNERWIDLDARVCVLEEYKRTTRRSFSPKPNDLSTSEGGLLKHGFQKQVP